MTSPIFNKATCHTVCLLSPELLTFSFLSSILHPLCYQHNTSYIGTAYHIRLFVKFSQGVQYSHTITLSYIPFFTRSQGWLPGVIAGQVPFCTVPPTNAKVGGGPWTHISKTTKIKTALLNILFAYTIIVFVRLLHNTKKHMVDPRINGGRDEFLFMYVQ